MPSLAFNFSVWWPHSDQGTTLHLFHAGWKSACREGVVKGVYVCETVDSQTVPKWDNPAQYRSTLCPRWSNLVQSRLVHSRKGVWMCQTAGLLGIQGSPPPSPSQSTQTERSLCTQHRHVFFDVRIVFKMSLGSWMAASAKAALQQGASEASSYCQSVWTHTQRVWHSFTGLQFLIWVTELWKLKICFNKEKSLN